MDKDDISTAYNPRFPRTIVQFPSTSARTEKVNIHSDEARQEYFPFLEEV